MKNFKKVLTVFLILICSVGLISCGKNNLSSPEKVLKTYIESLNSINYEKAFSLTNLDEVYADDFDEILEEVTSNAKDLPAKAKQGLMKLKVSNIERISESKNSVTLSFKLEIEDESEMFEAVFIKQNKIWKIDLNEEESEDFVSTFIP